METAKIWIGIFFLSILIYNEAGIAIALCLRLIYIIILKIVFIKWLIIHLQIHTPCIICLFLFFYGDSVWITFVRCYAHKKIKRGASVHPLSIDRNRNPRKYIRVKTDNAQAEITVLQLCLICHEYRTLAYTLTQLRWSPYDDLSLSTLRVFFLFLLSHIVMLKNWISKFAPPPSSSSTHEAQETLLNEQENTGTFKKSNDLLIYWVSILQCK